MDASGNVPAPGFFHHVDDNMYATLGDSIARALSASVISLYELDWWAIPTTLPQMPFLKTSSLLDIATHARRLLGKISDTRRLMIILPDDKRASTIELLSLWILKHHFTILELAQLIGILDSNATLALPMGTSRLFCSSGELSSGPTPNHLPDCAARQIKAAKKYHLLKARLPPHLEKRLVSLIARDIAALQWKSHTPIPMSNAIQHFLTEHHAYLSNPTNPWEIPITYIIVRDYNFLSTGDASELSVGAFCPTLGFWTCIDFHDDLRARFNLSPKNPLYMHINLFEFVIIIVQLAAAITRLEGPSSLSTPNARQLRGIPATPKIQFRSDNTTSVSWASKVSSKKMGGQALVRIWAALLKRTTIDVAIEHLPGASNTTADCISRPAPNSSSLISLRLPKLIQTEPEIASWDFFRPHPMLISMLASALSYPSSLAPVNLPLDLGRFETAASTTSSSALMPVLQLL